MKIVIRFFRVREADGAHAIIGCETLDAVDRDDAIALAARLRASLDMPQRPDGVTITDADGAPLHSALFTTGRETTETDSHEHHQA
ncbi:hypothetical protein [Stappia sp. WLB 29]|uniref:hypothetical protein n=1 Tax=Stappia sp. WLB 29 TaxID=2925220 RepID=UPI0020BE867C|nr:hypothetical protein [Stappia sp. WLB 29]